jgi:hypothetical protein
MLRKLQGVEQSSVGDLWFLGPVPSPAGKKRKTTYISDGGERVLFGS